MRPFGEVRDGMELVLLPAPDAACSTASRIPTTWPGWPSASPRTPWRCFDQPLELTNEDALWAIPQFHIVCTSTLATRDTALLDRARAEGRLWDIGTGHDLMITEPEKVTRALVQVAGG